MKILITEIQFKKLIENIINEQDDNNMLKSKMENWFVKNIINQVEEKTYLNKPNMMFYVNKNTGQTYMKYDIKNKDLMIDYYKIWSYFEDNYSDNYMEIIRLIKDLANKYLGLSNVKPHLSHILIYY